MEFVNYFVKMYKNKKQVALLTWAYCILAVVAVFVAGLCALINQSIGVGMLIIPLVAITALCMNVVTWSLVRFVIDAVSVRIAEKEAAEASTKKSSKK